MVYFPELFSNSSDKFGRLAIWLVTREGVVCPNIRDLFTAGGKGKLIIGKNDYNDVPRIFLTLFENLSFILEILAQTPAVELSEYWGFKTNEKKKITDWIELVSSHSKKIQGAKHIDLKQILSNRVWL